MLTAAWIYLALFAVVSGLKALGKLHDNLVGPAILHGIDAAFAAACAYAIYGVA